jgi:hypothetical protein
MMVPSTTVFAATLFSEVAMYLAWRFSSAIHKVLPPSATEERSKVEESRAQEPTTGTTAPNATAERFKQWRKSRRRGSWIEGISWVIAACVIIAIAINTIMTPSSPPSPPVLKPWEMTWSAPEPTKEPVKEPVNVIRPAEPTLTNWVSKEFFSNSITTPAFVLIAILFLGVTLCFGGAAYVAFSFLNKRKVEIVLPRIESAQEPTTPSLFWNPLPHVRNVSTPARKAAEKEPGDWEMFQAEEAERRRAAILAKLGHRVLDESTSHEHGQTS